MASYDNLMSSTSVYQLSPSLGPLSQLLCVGFLDFGTLLDAVHQFIAESVTIVNPFHCTLVVSNLKQKICFKLPLNLYNRKKQMHLFLHSF